MSEIDPELLRMLMADGITPPEPEILEEQSEILRALGSNIPVTLIEIHKYGGSDNLINVMHGYTRGTEVTYTLANRIQFPFDKYVRIRDISGIRVFAENNEGSFLAKRTGKDLFTLPVPKPPARIAHLYPNYTATSLAMFAGENHAKGILQELTQIYSIENAYVQKFVEQIKP